MLRAVNVCILVSHIKKPTTPPKISASYFLKLKERIMKTAKATKFVYGIRFSPTTKAAKRAIRLICLIDKDFTTIKYLDLSELNA